MEVKSDNIAAFEIPIKEFENYIAKDKKDEILDLISKHNEICSIKEYEVIKEMIQKACHDGDIDLLKILLSKEIETEPGVSFKINKIDKTASLFKIETSIFEYIVPRSIQYESEEYFVTSVISSGNSFRTKMIRSIKFENISKVRIIYGDSFRNSEFESISIPDSLIELRDGWCSNTSNLKKIIISKENNRFLFKDNKYLLGKTDSKSDDFDILLYARRDIKEITIPSSIKIISSFAFYSCSRIQKLEFPPDSNLNTIGEYSFSYMHILSICIPSSVKKICSNAFESSYLLRKVEFQSNSNLQSIEFAAFRGTCISSISIPSSVIKIGESAFESCGFLENVKIPYDSKLQTIEFKAFSETPIRSIYLPDNFMELKDFFFGYASNLSLIIVSNKNNRFIFKDNKYLLGKTDIKSDNYDILLFVRRDIKEITIPSTVKIISPYSFCNCEQIQKVEFSPDSNLHTIGEFSFYQSSVKSISIPSSVTNICKNAFQNCDKLEKVEIPIDSKLQTIENDVFSGSAIESIYIPSSVLKICENAFKSCVSLKKVEIPTNSKLKTIEKFSFENTKIEEFDIPEKLADLEEGFCTYSTKITKINISKKNKKFVLKNEKFLCTKTNDDIDDYDILLFGIHGLNEIVIPSNIKIISSFAFFSNKMINKVEFEKDSNLQTIGNYSFGSTNIESFSIPSNVSKICEYAFCSNKLKKVEIQRNSKLQIIQKYAFANASIGSLFIPSNVVSIEENAFHFCNNLQIVEISKDSKLKSFDIGINSIIIMVPSGMNNLINKK